MDEKAALRRRLRAARAARGASELAQSADAIARVGFLRCADASTVAAYASVGDEPPTRLLLDRLIESGRSVLLPVVTADGLAWGSYAGWQALTDRRGLLEPTGVTVTNLAATDLVLVPALAVDRHGHRLGRGAGLYDRALVGVPRERVVAVVFADEVLDAVPVQTHDVTVSAALTPAGFVELGLPSGPQ